MRFRTKDLLGVTALMSFYLAGGTLLHHDPGGYAIVAVIALGFSLATGGLAIAIFNLLWQALMTGGVLARVGAVRTWPPHLAVAGAALLAAFLVHQTFGPAGAGLSLYSLLSGVVVHAFLLLSATATFGERAVVVQGCCRSWKRCSFRVAVDQHGQAWMHVQTPRHCRNHRVRLPADRVEEVKSILAKKQPRDPADPEA